MCISVMFIYAHVHGMFTIKFALDVHIYEAEWRHTALHQPTLGLNTLSASSRPTQIYKLCILSVQTSMNKLDFSLNSSSPNDDDQIPQGKDIFLQACMFKFTIKCGALALIIGHQARCPGDDGFELGASGIVSRDHGHPGISYLNVT